MVFSGHGYTNRMDNRTYLALADSDIAESQLVCCAKQTIILDSCREYHTPIQEMRKFADGLGASVSGQIPNARLLYNQEIEKAKDGIIYMHAASIDQPASVYSEGSCYIQSLLEVSNTFGKSTGSLQILNVYSAHDRAIEVLKREYPLEAQNPTITGSIKRWDWFPFALRAQEELYYVFDN